jgi:hypothetical protein
LGGLLSAFVLFFTVLVVVATGILAAYAAVIGILHALAPRSFARTNESRAVAAGQARAAHAGGD